MTDKLIAAYSQKNEVEASGGGSDVAPFDHNTAHYRSTVRQRAGIQSIVMGFVMFQSNQQTTDMVLWWNQLINENFDSWYVTKYPDKVKWL